MQSLIGTLNFACKVVPPSGLPFLQRMIALTRKVKEQHHHIKLNSGFLATLRCGKHLSIIGMAPIFFLSSNWKDSNSFDLHSDASGALGFSGVFGTKWFQGAWAQDQ